MTKIYTTALLFVVLSFAGGYAQPPTKETDPTPPKEALKKFTTPDDLQLDLVLSEPVVKQPVFVNFDERGRMWVVQYLQYPAPAGLKIVSHDRYWRAIYDKVPPPPPNHFRGKDKITIHEDTNGDGIFDKHKTFVDGLNITTAVERGRGGVWVLNPPYLLFYPDKNNDDVPDGDPEVHIKGFGLEDTHSVVNSLCWGPDGWLYAAQGSTVSANVIRPGLDKKPQHSMGQLIWRYHPETRRYEIFAEGGGNAFGVEIDAKGRTFSGHNGGNTRGFHYVQGGYYRKGFTKHGPISNPFSFGYFPDMEHANVPRFTHTFLLYDGTNLPAKYHGKLFGVAPLQHHVVISDVLRNGSSFRTKDIDKAMATKDEWFRPVDIEIGPDGAIYVADWYDNKIAHFRNHESGRKVPSNGRIYRIRGKNSKRGAKPFDLAKLSTGQLIDVLRDPNRWKRRTALRVLGDRKDRTAIPRLKKLIAKHQDHLALEALWALNLCGGLDEFTALDYLEHDNPHVRLWTVRLMCDDHEVSTAFASRLAQIAEKEPHPEVRSQLACSARRLPANFCLPIVGSLLTRKEDLDDIHLPLLLWWAIEEHADSERKQIVRFFGDKKLWELPMVRTHILERVMRRYAQAGSRSDLMTCAKLLNLAPKKKHAEILLGGFEKAFSGRSLANLPDELVQAIAKHGGGSLELRLRQGQPKAIEEALQLLRSPKADAKRQAAIVLILGEIQHKPSVPLLLDLAAKGRTTEVRTNAFAALQEFSSPEIGQTVIQRYAQLADDTEFAAQSMLAGRSSWALQLMQAVDDGKIDKSAIDADVARKMTMHADEKITRLVEKHFGKLQGATTAEMQKRIAYLQETIDKKKGSPYAGKKLYLNNCAQCHKLFADGGHIGPDLTSYKRDDLTTMLVNIVNPSAEIREGYETHIALTKDGRIMTGLLLDQDNQVIVLRGEKGQDHVIAKDNIDQMKVLPTSLMPERLLAEYSDQQVRDLFAYLRSTQPLND